MSSASGTAGYYGGESTKDLSHIDMSGLATTDNVSGESEAKSLEVVQAVCQAGVKKIVITLDGALQESIPLGPCPVPDEDYTLPGPNGDEGTARIEAKIDEVKTQQAADSGVLTAIKGLSEDIKTLGQRVAAAVSAPEDGEPPGSFSGPDTGGAYTEQEAGGLDGAVADAQSQLNETNYTNWLNGMIPILPEEGEACPTFTFIMPVTHAELHVAPDCRVYDWMRAILYVSTVAACYGVVLGKRST